MVTYFYFCTIVNLFSKGNFLINRMECLFGTFSIKFFILSYFYWNYWNHFIIKYDFFFKILFTKVIFNNNCKILSKINCVVLCKVIGSSLSLFLIFVIFKLIKIACWSNKYQQCYYLNHSWALQERDLAW